MRWFKKPFSECFGISPGDCSSPGIYRIVVLSKVILMVLTVALAVYVIISCSIGVNAATVSDGNAPVETEAPEETSMPSPTSKPTPTPAPEPTASPVPEYVIENEVNLDGANLYGDAANVVLYAQEVVLASETEGETNTSAFPEKSGYFVVPVSDTECAYVPENYTYWIVTGSWTLVSNNPFYLHSLEDGKYKVAGNGTSGFYKLSNDGSVASAYVFFKNSECGHGHYFDSNWQVQAPFSTVYGGNYLTCTDEEVPDSTVLESIVLSSSSIAFSNLVSQSLTATVTPEDFSDELTWTSTDESVAKYSGGLVIPVADGTCQIIASYVNPDGTVISASCDVTVSLPVEDKEPTELEAFLQEPVEVDRYQYEILKRLEFVQYVLAIQIALIFILIFKRK